MILKDIALKAYYSENGIEIYHGNCRDVLPLLTSVDVVIADPPYSEHTHKKQWIGAALTKGKARNGTKFKELGFEHLDDETLQIVAQQCARLARRWSLVFSDLEGICAWREGFMDAGLEYVRTCIWDKVDSAPQFTGDRPSAGAEAIICAHPMGKKEWNGGGRRNVFRHPVNGPNQGSKPHPSTKPESLMRELISLFTNPNELILDCFMGSGSTLRAAKDLGRRAIGIEVEEKYCRVAMERLQQDILPFNSPERDAETQEATQQEFFAALT